MIKSVGKWLEILSEKTQNIEYYSSAEGGRKAYNITTNVVSITGTDERPLALLENPTGSGKDIYLDLGEFGATIDTQFRRYSGAVINTKQNAISGRNMSGNSTPSVLKFYKPGDFALSNVGTVSKTAFIKSYDTYFTNLKGRVILRPGSVVYWTIDQPTNNPSFNASVYFEYWELDAVA